MIKNKLVYFKTEKAYEENKSRISDQSIVFIEDSKKIITHGAEYFGNSVGPEGGDDTYIPYEVIINLE